MSAAKFTLIVLAPAALAACNSGSETPQANALAHGDAALVVSGETLAAAIAEDEQFASVAAALAQTGLNTMFDGPGSYTLLASTAPLPAAGNNADSRAVTAEILRNHILPGSVTRGAIEQAIAKSDGPVTMRTLGTATLQFSRDGSALIVTDPQTGRRATVTGTGRQATNGVLLPIDGLL